MQVEVTSMLCPACKAPLTMSDRQGVEIDYCAQCRGVWLDRGELDKIIERSAAELAPPPRSPSERDQRGYGDDGCGYGGAGGHRGGYGKHGGGHSGGYGKHGGYRRKSWLAEIFD